MTDRKQDKPVPVRIDSGPQPEEDSAPELAELEAEQEADSREGHEDAAEETDWQARYEELHEKYLRALADLQNYRRRMAQEMAQQRQYANENLLAELLPVTDNCNQALASICDTDDLECVARGVEMILDQLHGFMKRHNVSQVNPQGQPFDPDLHEAVEAVPTADVPENTVVEVVQPGYLLHDRLLRPARVKVAIAPDSSR